MLVGKSDFQDVHMRPFFDCHRYVGIITSTGTARGRLRCSLLILLCSALLWKDSGCHPPRAPIWTSRESLVRVVVLDLIRTLMIIKPG